MVLTTALLLMSTATAPGGWAEPDPVAPPAPPVVPGAAPTAVAAAAPAVDPTVVPAAVPAADAEPEPAGAIPSGNPGTLTTPEGQVLTVVASKESLVPVTALTNTPWSREYVVSGVFSGNVTGTGQSEADGGVLEAGYQIGCGITQQDLHSISTVGVTPGSGIPILDGSLLPVFISGNASQQLRVVLEPGRINTIAVTKKAYEGDWARVSVTGMRIKIDGCSGESFIRSFATFTTKSGDNAEVVTYRGVTRTV